MRLCKLETPQTIGFVAKMSSRLKLIYSTMLNTKILLRDLGWAILPAHQNIEFPSLGNRHLACG